MNFEEKLQNRFFNQTDIKFCLSAAKIIFSCITPANIALPRLFSAFQSIESISTFNYYLNNQYFTNLQKNQITNLHFP